MLFRSDLLRTPTNRGGETYENVVAFLDHMKKAEWTATELRRGLAANGVNVTAKKLSDVTNYLVRAGRHEVMEGRARSRHVVVEFPSYDAAIACYGSPEYQAAKALSRGNAEFDMLALEGYDGKN